VTVTSIYLHISQHTSSGIISTTVPSGKTLDLGVLERRPVTDTERCRLTAVLSNIHSTTATVVSAQ